jgi:hypothetical protein
LRKAFLIPAGRNELLLVSAGDQEVIDDILKRFSQTEQDVNPAVEATDGDIDDK